jgi:regulation of enolase protein 1 (concanavalin A-like superfamily)
MEQLSWTRAPKQYEITADSVTITTEPNTDLWQRTYYGFRNDNAPVLQLTTEERYFSFTAKAEFSYNHRYDQCGLALYLDSDNWCKASIEAENDQFQRLGSVVTNHGWSDWATTDIPASVTSMWYRLSRRESDFCLECSENGVDFRQMRIFHLWEGGETVRFGLYACSPEESSFTARFSDLALTECLWHEHE